MKRIYSLLSVCFLLTACDASPIGRAKKERNQKLISYSVTNVTLNSARFDWICSDETDGVLSYGKGRLDNTTFSLKPAKIHSMTLSGLDQNQSYQYKVFCGKTAGDLTYLLLNSSFQTLKPAESAAPLLSSAQIKRGIWILGGTDSSGTPIAQVDFFDPVDGKWVPGVTSVPTPRRYAGIVSSGGKIYVMGGLTGTTAVSTVEELTPGDTFSWKTLNSMPVTLQGFIAASNGSDIYAIGGSTTNNMQIGTLPAFSVYRFQPFIGTGGTWATITTASALYPNIDMSGCIIDGTFLFGGGRYYNDGSAQNSLNGYVIGSNTTTTISESNFTYPAHGTASVCYRPVSSDPYPSDTKALLIFGGSTLTDLNQPAAAVTPSAQFNYYQPLVNTMTSGPVLSSALYYPAAEISYDKRRLYLFGGATAVNAPSSSVYSIPMANPVSGPWQSETNANPEPAMPVARFGHKAVILSR